MACERRSERSDERNEHPCQLHLFVRRLDDRSCFGMQADAQVVDYNLFKLWLAFFLRNGSSN